MGDMARERTREVSLTTFAFGTFHTAIFLISAVLVLHLTGSLAGLLGSLNTLTGLALFAALWVTTTWSTSRAFRAYPLTDLSMPTAVGEPIVRALRAGALNGILFLAAAAVILALSAVLTGQGQSVLVFIFGGVVFATVGTLGSATVGAIIGVLLAAIDLVLIWASHRLLPG